MSCTVVVGDIHGCLEEFKALSGKLQEELPRSFGVGVPVRVICLGDFLDKGPEPAGCVRWAREAGFESVLGNHEEKALRWLRHVEKAKADPKYKNPMRPLGSVKEAQYAALSDEDVAWLRGLPIKIEMALPEPWVIVHGGFLPNVPLDKQKVDHMLRVRWVDGNGKYVALNPEDPRQPEGTRTWMEDYGGFENVVYGHAAHSLSTVRDDGPNSLGSHSFGIDTGCVYGGHLTAFVLETRQVIQVKAAKVYAEPPFPIPA